MPAKVTGALHTNQIFDSSNTENGGVVSWIDSSSAGTLGRHIPALLILCDVMKPRTKKTHTRTAAIISDRCHSWLGNDGYRAG